MLKLKSERERVACVILPTLQEGDNIRALLPLIFEQAPLIPSHQLHVLVVDDNSMDGTGETVLEFMRSNPRLHLLPGERKGLGVAYRRGIAHALDELHAHLILIMDADFQHDPHLIPRFVELCDSRYDLVIGSRFAPGGATPNFPWFRRLISLTGTRLVRRLGGLTAHTDCTSGYRCIRASMLARCNLARLPVRGYSFNAESLWELIQNGASFIEIPIVFDARREGRSKLSFRDKIEFVLFLGRLYFRARSRSSDMKGGPS